MNCVIEERPAASSPLTAAQDRTCLPSQHHSQLCGQRWRATVQTFSPQRSKGIIGLCHLDCRELGRRHRGRVCPGNRKEEAMVCRLEAPAQVTAERQMGGLDPSPPFSQALCVSISMVTRPRSTLRKDLSFERQLKHYGKEEDQKPTHLCLNKTEKNRKRNSAHLW